MNFYDELQQETTGGRHYLMSAPIINDCIEGNFTIEHYVAFLTQAFHHVKHTTPLLMATGSRIPPSKEWLREAVAEYIEEELGHQEWILNDIERCGFDKEKARSSMPNMATELMVAYAYDVINRVNPLGFFGMVQVLEGTSIKMADTVANLVQQKLKLPDQAFSYLRSHGKLDQEHIKFYEGLMNQIVHRQEKDLIIHCANVFYHLYGNIFRSLKPGQANALAA